MYEIKSLDYARKLWGEFLQKELTHILPDDIAQILSDKGIHLKWHRIENWESLDDQEIYREISSEIEPDSGNVCVLTDDFYFEKKSLVISSEKLPVYVENHLKQFEKCFFDGLDILALSLDYRWFWIFHHEGFFARWIK